MIGFFAWVAPHTERWVILIQDNGVTNEAPLLLIQHAYQHLHEWFACDLMNLHKFYRFDRKWSSLTCEKGPLSEIVAIFVFLEHLIVLTQLCLTLLDDEDRTIIQFIRFHDEITWVIINRLHVRQYELQNLLTKVVLQHQTWFQSLAPYLEEQFLPQRCG